MNVFLKYLINYTFSLTVLSLLIKKWYLKMIFDFRLDTGNSETLSGMDLFGERGGSSGFGYKCFVT